MSYKVKFRDDSESLSHYGVKGQEWGVRRYQNEDGTLTPLGKRHYESEKKAQSKYNTAIAVSALGNAAQVGGNAASLAAKSAFPKPQKPKREDYKTNEDFNKAEENYKLDKEDYNAANKVSSSLEKSSNDIKTSSENRSKSIIDQAEREHLSQLKDEIDLSNVSDDDLRGAINRIQMENTYKSLTAPTVDSGADKARQTIAVIGGLASATITGLTIAKLVKDLKGN